MKATLPIALIADHDVGLLKEATRLLREAEYQVLARLSPRGLLEIAEILRPELLLLGISFWHAGWASLFRSASPDTLIFPFGEDGAVPGVLGLKDVSALFAFPALGTSSAA